MMIHICISFSGSKVYLSTWLVYLCKCTLFNFAKKKKKIVPKDLLWVMQREASLSSIEPPQSFP